MPVARTCVSPLSACDAQAGRCRAAQARSRPRAPPTQGWHRVGRVRGPCVRARAGGGARGPQAIVLGLNGVVGDVRDLYLAAAFETARELWGQEVLPGSSWLLYRQRGRDAWAALNEPWEATVLLRVLAAEGVVGGRSLKSGRAGPSLARDSRQDAFQRGRTGVRPLAAVELVENWDMALEASLLRWGALASVPDLKDAFSQHTAAWLRRIEDQEDKYAEMAAAGDPEEADVDAMRSFDSENMPDLVPEIVPHQPVVASINAACRLNSGGDEAQCRLRLYCAGDAGISWEEVTAPLLRRMGVADGAMAPQPDHARPDSGADLPSDVRVVEGCAGGLRRWRGEVGRERVEAILGEGASLARAEVRLAGWGWASASQRAREERKGATVVDELLLAEMLGVSECREVMDGVAW
ncbi:unnamed protein product [Pedinophyceae sp. YPF-701]|nr:unnamed protein product [Pedinophyceae sp. YPF-701]